MIVIAKELKTQLPINHSAPPAVMWHEYILETGKALVGVFTFRFIPVTYGRVFINNLETETLKPSCEEANGEPSLQIHEWLSIHA